MKSGRVQVRDNRYNIAISAITYGLHCFVLDPKSNKLYSCILTIHEEYINILHLIINEQASYLLKLHQIYNITDNQYTTESKLKEHDVRTNDHIQITILFSIRSHLIALPLPLRLRGRRIFARLLSCSLSGRPNYTTTGSISMIRSRLRP